MLTTNAVSRLLHSIIGGISVSSTRSQKMIAATSTQFSIPKNLSIVMVKTKFLALSVKSLPQNAKIWSKAGWMSRVRPRYRLCGNTKRVTLFTDYFHRRQGKRPK